MGLTAGLQSANLDGMETPTDVYGSLLGMGLNKGYASLLANGKRQPSLKLSLRIFDATGLRLGLLEGAPDEEVARLRSVAGSADSEESEDAEADAA
jgi:hypothetical protein